MTGAARRSWCSRDPDAAALGKRLARPCSSYCARPLGFSVHVLAARRRWDLSDDEEAAGARPLDGGVTYLTEARAEPREALAARVMRKAGYVLGAGRHPFGWWLPGTLAETLRALARRRPTPRTSRSFAPSSSTTSRRCGRSGRDASSSIATTPTSTSPASS